MDNELYQEVLLQHSKRPKNFGPMEYPTHSADGHNALCGDEISVALRIEDDSIADIKFTGNACAICTASASIMTIEIKGLTCDAAGKLASDFRVLAKEGAGPDVPTRLRVMGGVHQFPQRVKCAVLPWETLTHAIQQPIAAAS